MRLLILLNEPTHCLDVFGERREFKSHLPWSGKGLSPGALVPGAGVSAVRVSVYVMDAGFSDCQGLFLHLLVTAPGFSSLGSPLSSCALGGAVSTREKGQ